MDHANGSPTWNPRRVRNLSSVWSTVNPAPEFGPATAYSGPERLPKTIYVRFGDSFWMDPQTYQDDIILDQTAPRIPAATLVLPHRGPDRLQLTARDNVSGVGSVQLRKGDQRPSEWRNFASSIKLPHGARRLRVRVRDRAGNGSKWVAAELNRRRR